MTREGIAATRGRQDGLSINDLAGRSGLDRSTVVELLGGRRGVGSARMDTLWALAWALEVEDFATFLVPLTTASDNASPSATDGGSAPRT